MSSSRSSTAASRPASSTPPSAASREELASAQRAQASDVMAAVASTERHLSSRIDRLEATVNAHDDLIQQLRGARNLLALIFGTSVLTAVLGLLTLLGPTMPRWRQAPARPYLVAHWYW